jgi:hypothetical protein
MAALVINVPGPVKVCIVYPGVADGFTVPPVAAWDPV